MTRAMSLTGNQGVVACQSALQHGFVQGAEGYWRFREKILYRFMLAKAIFSAERTGRPKSARSCSVPRHARREWQ